MGGGISIHHHDRALDRQLQSSQRVHEQDGGQALEGRGLDEFNRQFQDNVDRVVFKAVFQEEAERYKGPVNYISMVEAFKAGRCNLTSFCSTFKLHGACENIFFSHTIEVSNQGLSHEILVDWQSI
jgi:hypothetical protein